MEVFLFPNTLGLMQTIFNLEMYVRALLIYLYGILDICGPSFSHLKPKVGICLAKNYLQHWEMFREPRWLSLAVAKYAGRQIWKHSGNFQNGLLL